MRLASPAISHGLVLVVNGPDGSFIVPLHSDTTLVLGRDAPSDVVIADDSVSRRHARVVIRGEERSVEDLGSRNGTFVDGHALEAGERRALEIGTRCELGSTTVMLGLGDTATWRPEATTKPGASSSGEYRAAVPVDPALRVVNDPKMERLYALLDVIALSPLSVLLLGETGVGKQVFAEAVHQRSTRRNGPFLQLNCAALPESILENELFGHERGAYTGAVGAKAGLLESADGGTIFLDEIGEVPLSMQAKLLRVLESGQVMRLGSVKLRQVNVRFVSATNRDPKKLVTEGRFRADFYFRLNGMTLTIPPLRERPQEIAPLARSILERAAFASRKQVTLTDAAIEALMAYPWPGNIRELKNVIERAAVMCPGNLLDVDALVVADSEAFGPTSPSSPSIIEGPPTPPFRHATSQVTRVAPLREQWNEYEKQAILEALAKTAWNQSRAAKLLGMSRHTLIARMASYGCVRPRDKD